MYRTNREMLDIASSILLPRLTDNRFSGQQQQKIVDALTSIAHVRCLLNADSTFPEESAASFATELHAHALILGAMDAGPTQLDPWELYNASDLLETLSTCAADAVAGADTTL